MLCHCGESLLMRRITNTNKFQEIAECDNCHRSWVNIIKPSILDPKQKLPLGVRHPRPRVKKDK